MARQKTSSVEDVLALVGKLPWWGGLTLAFVSYLALHEVASRPLTSLVDSSQVGDFLAKSYVMTLAVFGQYILPFTFGLVALVSVINTVQRKMLYRSVMSSSGVEALSGMDREDFESLVGEYFRRNGFRVIRMGGNGAEGGIDLVLRRQSETYLVQCKQEKTYKVGVQSIREFYGVMTSQRATGGYFVISGEYTDEAKLFAKGLNLILVDGLKLREMIDATGKVASSGALESASPATATPVCSKCGSDKDLRG